MRLFYDDLLQITVEEIDEEITFYIEDKEYLVSKNKNIIYLDEPFELGKQIRAYDEYGRNYAVYPRFIVQTDYFEENYTDSNVRLGSYLDAKTSVFRLWAPTAHRVYLWLDGKEYPMKRMEKGFYEISFAKNCHGQSYFYEIAIADEIYRSEDPYAIASLPNRKASVFCDLNQLELDICEGFTVNENETILEVHVRDFSMDPKIPFQYRGQFLGLLESYGGKGYKHILDLGVDWIQLMPVNDFATVDEYNPNKRYNWGYDPMQFFVLEGSYSSNIDDPFQVMRDFAKVVDQYHKDGLKVSVDVVFNHVYEAEESSFHKTVPYYYFRYHPQGTLSNGSFCGNEFASEKIMASKLIVEVCEYFTHVFKIDGYRFDLMGLLDQKTMQAIQSSLPHVFLYGEGWSMPSIYDEAFYARLSQAKKQTSLAYFNDRSRDFIAGALDASKEGILDFENLDMEKALIYLTGDLENMAHAQQNIHYIECHDNLTLADRLVLQKHTEKEAQFLMEVLLASQGHVLLQIGQSFFRSKQFLANTYRSPDEINHIEWERLSQYQSLNESISQAIKIRRHRGDLMKTEIEDWKLKLWYEHVLIVIDFKEKVVSYDENACE